MINLGPDGSNPPRVILYTALTRNMSDIYVQYEATVSVTHSVWRIIVKVPRGKIDQYRIDHGDQCSDDTTIARKLSEEPSKRIPYLAQLSTYSLGVSYSDTFPPTLRPPFLEQDGMTFWDA